MGSSFDSVSTRDQMFRSTAFIMNLSLHTSQSLFDRRRVVPFVASVDAIVAAVCRLGCAVARASE